MILFSSKIIYEYSIISIIIVTFSVIGSDENNFTHMADYDIGVVMMLGEIRINAITCVSIKP